MEETAIFRNTTATKNKLIALIKLISSKKTPYINIGGTEVDPSMRLVAYKTEYEAEIHFSIADAKAIWSTIITLVRDLHISIVLTKSTGAKEPWACLIPGKKDIDPIAQKMKNKLFHEKTLEERMYLLETMSNRRFSEMEKTLKSIAKSSQNKA